MKLHLGCGNRYIPGFYHIDGIESENVNLVSKLEDLGQIKTESVELIYASHVLEHFGRLEVPNVLVEWMRVLKPGGVMRLAVPDFDAVCRVYLESKNIEVVKGLVCGGQNYKYNFHYNIFDFESLENLLLKIGMKKVYRYDWRVTEHSEIDDFSQAYIPHMDKKYGTLMSLNVEAVK